MFTINNRATYNGVWGTIVTILIFGLVMSYGIHRFAIVYKRGESTFQRRLVKDNLDQTKVFSFDETHFNFALGIADGTAVVRNIEDYKKYLNV